MGKIKRDGYIIIWKLADHLPIHIHVYKDKQLICRWGLEQHRPLSGKVSKSLENLLLTLEKEGHFETLLMRDK